MRARYHVVAGGHEGTVGAAEDVLRAGGNAFHAAVAAMAAACAAEPVLASPGGGGFLLACPAGGRARVYDFFVQTPLARRPLDELEFYPIVADFGTATQEFHIGRGTSATPGFVAGLFAVHRELGRMPMPELLAPAVQLAKEGVLFHNAYTPNSKCAPSRAIILTGRYSWQLEEAGNHMCYFPAKFGGYVERLAADGYVAGFTGKG